VAPGLPLQSGADTLAFGCASCHFGQLPDGRYAVGAPNHDYEYGAQMLALLLLPQAASPGFNESEHHPDAIAEIQDALAHLRDNNQLRWELIGNLLPLLGESAQEITTEYELGPLEA